MDEIVKNSGEKGQDIIREQCGLPVSTYFSASKVQWCPKQIGGSLKDIWGHSGGYLGDIGGHHIKPM